MDYSPVLQATCSSASQSTPDFMEPEASLPSSHEAAICVCPKPD
jgi:hypothetical protein